MRLCQSLYFGLLISSQLSLLVTGGCATFSDSHESHQQVVKARQLTQQGVRAMHREDWETAAGLLAEAKASCPYDHQSRAQFAEALWNQGQQDQALAELEEIAQLASEDATIHTRLGRMYLDLGNPTKAHMQANRAIECNPKHASAWNLQGDLATLRNDLENAKLCYIRAATNSDAVSPNIQLRLARTYRQLGAPQRSLACISLVQQAELGKNLPAAIEVEQALAMHDLGRYQGAATRFSDLAQRNALSAQELYIWAKSEFAIGRLAQAHYAATAALRIDPYHRATLNLVAQMPLNQDDPSWRR